MEPRRVLCVIVENVLLIDADGGGVPQFRKIASVAAGAGDTLYLSGINFPAILGKQLAKLLSVIAVRVVHGMVAACGTVSAGVGVTYEVHTRVQPIAFGDSLIHKRRAVLVGHGNTTRSARVCDSVGLQEPLM